MEPMTGFDLLREVRGDPVLKRTPFILVTANPDRERGRGEEGRRDDYILKPFDAYILKIKIDSVFATAAEQPSFRAV